MDVSGLTITPGNANEALLSLNEPLSYQNSKYLIFDNCRRLSVVTLLIEKKNKKEDGNNGDSRKTNKKSI